jgi:putative transposase
VHQHFAEVRSVVGYIKGKSAIQIAQKFGEKRNFTWKTFRARGCHVSTAGLDEAMIRACIRNQELEVERHEQLKMSV